jgi:hypothetical protein
MVSNNRLDRPWGRVFVEPRSEVDDLDKAASFVVDATVRRSTSLLDVLTSLARSQGNALWTYCGKGAS